MLCQPYLLLLSVAGQLAAPDRVDFQRDVRPLLSDKCFSCHGPDEKSRQAGLRLDVREAVVARRDGGAAIAPDAVERSQVLVRVSTSDATLRMPPPSTNKSLTPRDVDLLRRWIAQGAEYASPWSWRPPRPAPLPNVDDPSWSREPLDRFVQTGLSTVGLTPSRPADAAVLLRRLTLDLTGLSPTIAEADEYLADAGPDAYERQLDRLSASPRFGEHAAVAWLDAARYADTNGYFSDTARQAWPWRDALLRALNRGQRFDEFTLEQLAGDLFAAPTVEQQVASGFLRQHPVTNETGIIDEEYRVEYVADRLETVGATWLGLTVGCARCHDHKYDPLSQVEYYRLFSLFNQGPETGLVSVDDPPPTIDASTAEQRAAVERLTTNRQALERRHAEQLASLAAHVADWESSRDSHPRTPEDAAAYVSFASAEPGVREIGTVAREPGVVGDAGVFDAQQHLELAASPRLAADSAWSIGLWLKPTGSLNGIWSKIESTERRRGVELVGQKGRFQLNLVDRWGSDAIEVVTGQPTRGGDWRHVIVTYDGSRRAAGVTLYVDGEAVATKVIRDTLAGPIDNDEPFRVGRRDTGLGFYGRLDELRILPRATARDAARAWYWSERLRGPLAAPPERRSAEQRRVVEEYFLRFVADEESRATERTLRSAREQEQQARRELPRALVMHDRPEWRRTFVLARGRYDQPEQEVRPGLPAFLSSAERSAVVRNRLDLARWLVEPDHPLTARVAVNRLWQQCFGEGLVRTANDFGAQGEPPSHQELLDWLASDFQTHWDPKRTLRRITTSATYRQASQATEAAVERDPENRRLGRGPRYRLTAETLRDQALAASGLLVERQGGPSVKPYQPPGLWEAVSYDGDLTYEPDRGAGLWRRSLYTFWKRQSPPPTATTFDSPTRETCSTRRLRTNTPLQALVVLNDPTYVEAARVLAATSLQATTDELRVAEIFRRVLVRAPTTAERDLLVTLARRQRDHFVARPHEATRLVGVGESSIGRDAPAGELAAWTIVAQSVLMLDEAFSRP